MGDGIPASRIQLQAVASKQFGAMYRLESTIETEERLANLVKTRASQVNGCAYCVDMHWKDARAAGETEERLYSLSMWRESPLYEEHERAALALAEAITLVADSHVPDEVWERAEAHFGEDELAQLIFTISAVNAWNRLMITARVEPGHYEPASPQVA